MNRVLINPDTGEKQRSQLIKTKYLPSLENVVWKAQLPGEVPLDAALQLFFRRYRVDFQILKHPSDSRTKYDLFQRLNRGGAYANEQEVRTCSMVLANADFTRRLREFANEPNFRGIFRLTDDQRNIQKDVEYAVRAIALTHTNFPPRRDVQEFLDQVIIDLITKGQADSIMGDVMWAVRLLHRLLGDDALIPPDERAMGIAARFSLRALEGIAVGIARNRVGISALPNPETYIADRVAQFWQQDEVAEMSASGLRGTVRIQRSVPFGARWFNPNA